MFKEYTINVTTTGTAGSATGTGYTETVINGEVIAVKVDYHASAPGTTTVAISEDGGMARTILSLAAGNTDVVRYPRVQMQDTSGVPLANIVEPIAVGGRRVKAVLAASDALTNAVIVTLVVKQEM